jgi:hypothetical protein
MSDALITTLKTLKLFGMADTIAHLAEQASPAYQQALPTLDTLLKAEVAERETIASSTDRRSLQCRSLISD